MSKSPFFIVLIATGLANPPLLVPRAQAAANAQVRSAQQAFNTAQSKLGTAQQNWNRAQQDLAKAATAHQTASNKVHRARLTAAQHHWVELGMAAAAAERDAASRVITVRRDIIDHEIKTRGDYLAAETEADAARKRLGEIADDKSLTDEQQQKLASELSAKLRRPTELRKAAEAGDSQVQKASKQRQTAEKKILEIQPRLRKLIDSDPEVIKAGQEEKQTAAALEKARSAAGRVDQEVANAQMALERQNQILQAAIAQSRRHR